MDVNYYIKSYSDISYLVYIVDFMVKTIISVISKIESTVTSNFSQNYTFFLIVIVIKILTCKQIRYYYIINILFTIYWICSYQQIIQPKKISFKKKSHFSGILIFLFDFTYNTLLERQNNDPLY